MERETQNQRQRNWTRHKPRPRRKNSGPAQAGDVLPALLASLGGGPERARLSLLWQNWEPIMGPELAPLALPLGHHKDILLIGAEDAMLMQELHLMSGEILERVNAFMESPFFKSIKVSLVLNKTVLRPAIRETTALGAAYLAGLATGVWKDRGEIRSLWHCNMTFTPNMEAPEREKLLAGWHKAVGRSRDWAEHE